ncbi:hypothetical protein BegalDRAFT_1544 [Beggiatoa alba B18LD]|uniref:Orc1-like AAA ATPase domain-containing protein n=1 Tax=Beggiatoa alba B18LD TaxID=395493 RepID=I3CFN2_9GAMM|nr:ATP-binding protein [Beggiatoa alba]EIJ42425.1 hypothetical protein BegalDRAFT_1544 [Beggiatoa alba B18LD]
MTETMANYYKERQAFSALWQAQCEKRIVFYRGESGSGKSTLLKACRRQVPDSVHKIVVNCADAEIRVVDIFSLLIDKLGWERLGAFRQQLASLSPQVIGKIDNNEIEGNGNIIQQVINIGSPEERKDRQAHLTDAWLQDMKSVDKPLLFIIDTYDKSIEEMQNFLHRLLTRMVRLPALRLVMAGQSVPNVETCSEWTDCCDLYDLYGVKEAEHWLPVVTEMKRRFPDGIEPHSYLAGICGAFQGRPADIKKFIESFPRV